MLTRRPVEQAAQALVQHLATHPCDSRLTILYIELTWANPHTAHQFEASSAGTVMTEYLTNILKSQGGTLLWSVGSALLVAFGAPSIYDTDEWRATRAAHMLLWTLRSGHVMKLFEAKGAADMVREAKVGAVLHTFSQFQLNTTLAENQPFQHELNELMGLISPALKQDIILATHLTHSHTQEITKVEPFSAVTLAPNNPPTEVYHVVDVVPFSPEMLITLGERVNSPMIGREYELRLLQDALQIAAHQGVGGMMTIMGESGMGKSRLLYELRHWISDQNELGFWFFQSQATEQMATLPYSLIRRLFAWRFHIKDSDPAVAAAKKFAAGITGFMGENYIAEAHFIGYLLGYDFSHSPHLKAILDDTPQIHDRAFHYIVEFFRSIAGINGWPAVLMFEDVQLADHGSLDVLHYMAQYAHDVPLVILCSAHPSLLQRYPHWKNLPPNATRLNLEKLPPTQSHALLQNILHKAGDIPENFMETLITKAAGNPYHLEELVKSLIQSGAIEPGSDQWEVKKTALADSQFPATLPDLVRERVTSLPTEEQTALMCASVIGRVFWDSAIADLAGWSLADTRALLQKLVEQELIFEREVSAFNRTTEYNFSHETLHRVCYETISANLLRHYHARVATWLIGRGMERVGQIAGLIAEHFARAGETHRAVKWYGLAGKQARDTYAPEAAIDYFQTALSLLPYESDDISQRMLLMEGVGRSLQAIGQYAEAAIVFRDLAWVSGAEGDLPMQARALSRLATVQDRQGNPETALETARTAVRLAEEAGEEGRPDLITALISEASASVSIGQLEPALEVCQRAHEIAVALENREQIVYTLNMTGVVQSRAGRYAEAMQAFNEAMWLARDLGDVRREAILSNNLGELGRRRGEYRKAMALFQHAAETARSIAYRTGEMTALNNMGVIRVYLGDFAPAEHQLRTLIPRLEKVNHRDLLIEAYCYLAEAVGGLGRHEEALDYALRSLHTATQANSVLGMGIAWRTLGRIAYHSGNPIKVDERVWLPLDCFKESLRIFTEGRMDGEHAQTLRTWAHYEIVAGDFSKGEKMWYQARAGFIKLGADAESQRMERLPHDRRLTL